jgi:hypothetical protein
MSESLRLIDAEDIYINAADKSGKGDPRFVSSG